MISLTSASSKSGSMGRRNGRINSKLTAEISLSWKPGFRQASASVEEKASSGLFLGVQLIVRLLFRAGLLGPVELQDRSHAHFPHALLLAGLLVRRARGS